MDNIKGYFIPVFHAAIPHGLEHSLEEQYLFEYLADSFYPLLRVFEGLENEGIEYGFTLSVSPVLAGMLENPTLMLRFADYVQWRIAVAEQLQRDDQSKSGLADYYINKFKNLLYWHIERYKYRPLKAMFNLAALGNLSVIFSNAGGGILPVLEGVHGAAQAEVRGAVSEYEFLSEGAGLKGVWLTELAYSVGNEEILSGAGIEYFFVAEDGLKEAPLPVVNGCAKPVILKNGLVAFATNKRFSDKIGVEPMAYCLDENYACKDDEALAELGNKLLPEKLRATGAYTSHNGITLHTKAGGSYSPSYARDIADKHAKHYLAVLCEEVQRSQVEDAVVVVSLDHEAVGGAWEELPVFIDMLLRKMRYDQDVVRSSTACGYLETERQLQLAAIADSSSCTDGVFSEFYKNEREKYLPELHLAATKLEQGIFNDKRIADQMARELVLAAGGEWRYYLRKGIDEEYPRERQRKRLARFAACEEMLNGVDVDLDTLAAIEAQCAVLSTVGIASFAKKS